MAKLYYTFISILLFPLVSVLYLCCSSKNKELVKQDVSKWAEWKHIPSTFYGMVYMFAFYPEFRTIFYHRTGKIKYLFNWIIRGKSNLYINTREIGGGLLIQHGFATILMAEKIGNNCKIFQQVTVGYNGDKCPVIGNNVIISAGAKIIGGVSVGNNVIVGANAVVVKDVPDNSVVGGVPAKVIKQIDRVDILK